MAWFNKSSTWKKILLFVLLIAFVTAMDCDSNEQIFAREKLTGSARSAGVEERVSKSLWLILRQ
jgi:hypothetical protein